MLAKTKLNTIEVFISKALTDSNICHDLFMLINNKLEEFDDMKKEIKNSSSTKWIFIVLNFWCLLKIKRKIDAKISLYSCCIDCVFKTFKTIDEVLSYLLEVSI